VNCGKERNILHLHSDCPHGDSALEAGYSRHNHGLLFACRICWKIMFAALLEEKGWYPAGEEEPPVWGWQDWELRAEGRVHTWLALCHPSEITYDKTNGWVTVECCHWSHRNRNMRFAIAPGDGGAE
jgi:hypothetical protein